MRLQHISALKRDHILIDQEHAGNNVVTAINKTGTTDVHRSMNMIPNENDVSTNETTCT